MKQTELQILVRALTALQYEMRATTMAVRAPDFVCAKMHELQAEAKALMQSAQADADVAAIMEQAREEGVQIQFVLHGEQLAEPIEPGDTAHKRDLSG